jgi:hypothetical protein
VYSVPYLLRGCVDFRMVRPTVYPVEEAMVPQKSVEVDLCPREDSLVQIWTCEDREQVCSLQIMDGRRAAADALHSVEDERRMEPPGMAMVEWVLRMQMEALEDDSDNFAVVGEALTDDIRRRLCHRHPTWAVSSLPVLVLPLLLYAYKQQHCPKVFGLFSKIFLLFVSTKAQELHVGSCGAEMAIQYQAVATADWTQVCASIVSADC